MVIFKSSLSFFSFSMSSCVSFEILSIITEVPLNNFFSAKSKIALFTELDIQKSSAEIIIPFIKIDQSLNIS